MDLREIQYKELDILKYVISILDKHKLSYFMLGGTLLGAIRHKGFIPWDDDIDIGIPRHDYTKFIEIFSNLNHDYFRIRYFKQDKTYKKYFIKIEDIRYPIIREDTLDIGKTFIWIDIFPLDGMPSGYCLRKVHMAQLLVSRLFLQYSCFRNGVNFKKKRSLLERVLIVVGYLVSGCMKQNQLKWLDSIDRLLQKNTYTDSKYVVNFMGAYKFKEMFPKEYYGDGNMYNFEDIELPGPREYDKVLKQMYGDYMTPPNMDQRFSHSITAGQDHE